MLARANAHLCASATLRLSGTIYTLTTSVFLPQGIKQLVYATHISLCVVIVSQANSDCRSTLLYYDGFKKAATHIFEGLLKSLTNIFSLLIKEILTELW